MAIYNKIGKIYDTTRRADPYLVSRLARHLKIHPPGNYLDAACGTGNYTFALASEYGGKWFGIDQSSLMVGKAQMKDGGNFVEWGKADVVSLPFKDEVFDGAICTLAIHHFEDLKNAFGEIRRTLKDQSPFVIFTSLPQQTRDYWLAKYFPRAIEKSAEWLPDLETIKSALHQAGFSRIKTEAYQVRKDLQDFFLYSGKYKPEMYLDKRVRANISTFSLLADAEEIENGCQRLIGDIESGKIREIVERHSQTDDYSFVIAQT